VAFTAHEDDVSTLTSADVGETVDKEHFEEYFCDEEQNVLEREAQVMLPFEIYVDERGGPVFKDEICVLTAMDDARGASTGGKTAGKKVPGLRGVASQNGKPLSDTETLGVCRT